MASSAPWTPDELRRNARSWTLEGDARLLEYMQTISQNLEKRAQNTNSKMNQLVLNLEETSVSLDNVTNKLSALQHSQFVENRVYEDDETIANESEVPVDVQNEKEKYDPIETLNKVLKNSIAMMDKCYEKVSIDVEDSDDEEGLSKSIVYKPKNFFEHRPLPHIIGSKEWKEKWHIGLCDTDEEYSDEENKEEYSDTSENVSLSASLPSNAPTLSESESSVWGLHPHMNAKRPPLYSPSSDEEISSNTLTSKTSSEDINRLNNNKQIIQPPQVLPPPEQRYYVHKPKEKGLFDESSEESEEEVKRESQKGQVKPIQQTEKKVKKPVVNGISNIISDEPPEFDEVDRPEDSESNQLFYESEEENTKKEKVKNSERGKTDTFSNIRKKPVNLFDDDDFDSFMKELDKKATEKLSQTNATKSVKNLFDDSLEDEPELPANSTPPTMLKPETPPVVPERKVYKTSLFDDEPEEDNIFANITQKSKSSISASITKKVRNLFDDSSDDDFENIFKSKENNLKKANTENDTNEKTQLRTSDSINNTDHLFENIQNNSSKVSQPTPSLFSNVTLEDNIFKDNEKIEVTKDDDNSKKSFSTSKIEEGKEDSYKRKNDIAPVNSKVEELFSTDDEDDIFATLSRPPVPTPRASTDAGSKAQVSRKTTNAMQSELGIPKDSAKSFEDEVEQLAPADETNSETVSQIVTAQLSEPKDKIVDLFEGKLSENESIKKPIMESANETKNPTLSSILFDDEPPDDDIFNISVKENNLERVVPKSVNVNIEDSNGSDKSKDTNVAVDKIESSSDSQSISSQLKLPDLFDDESLLNNLEKDVLENVKINTDEDGSMNKFKNIDMLSDKTENKVNSPPISNKFKLPDLFDDEPPNDDDDLFSDLSKISPVTSGQLDVNNSIENAKIFAKSNRDTPQNDIIISKNSDNQEEKTEKENSENIVVENENLKIDISSNVDKEKNSSQHNANNILSQLLEEPSPDDVPRQENNSNVTIMKESRDLHQKNDLKTAFPKEINNEQHDNDPSLTSSGNKDNPGASLYNTINLFQDIPPDDDFPNSSDTKRLHNIFYDDIAETIPTTSTYSRKQPSNYFFSDEPPPDSFDDDTISDTEKELPIVDQKSIPSPTLPVENIKQAENVPKNDGQSETDNKSFSVADLIKKAGAEPEYKKPKTNVPARRKLNSNLNINVAALVPGAKRPNLKTEDSIRKQSSTEDEESSSSSSLFSNPLRQSSTESMSPSIATVVTPSKSADPNILPNLTKTRPKMQGKRPSTREGRQEKYRKSLILDATDSIPSQRSNSLAQPLVESKSDNIREENQSSTLVDSHQLSGENVENNSISEKVDIPEDDWLMKSIQSEQIKLPSQNFNEKKQTQVSKVFNDVDDDDDDIFASVGKTVGEPVKSTGLAIPRTATAPPEIKTTQDSKTIKPKEPPRSEAKATKSLFSDDESGDDDLFGSTQKKTKGPALKTPVVKSKDKIFSSDDDDEDIFGKTSRDSKDDSKNEKKLFKRLPLPSSKSLFGDEDDDDDIFGNTSVQGKVATTRVVTAPKKPENPEKRSPVGSITGDNPLADLLND